jgi:hypothetical protein
MYRSAKQETGKRESQEMYLNLLEFTYAVRDREAVEIWLSQAELDAVLISTEQYYDEILAVLASEQSVVEAHKKLLEQPAITSCTEKRCVVYRVTTTVPPQQVIQDFPTGEDQDWYLGTDNTSYLCVQSHPLNDRLIAWLDTNPLVANWDYLFDLNPMPLGC